MPVIFTKSKLLSLLLLMAIWACSNQVHSGATKQIATVTPLTLPPTWTSTPTPLSQSAPKVFPTLTSSPVSTLTPTFSLPDSWFIIPELTLASPSHPINTNTFKGIRFPPWPDNVIQEFIYVSPYGEVPSGTIFYQLLLMRRGNERMLWLGTPFIESDPRCEGRIYDAIQLPPTQAGDVLIPFTCMRNNEFDMFLIVVAAYPEEGQPATDIHYAWRIDPANTTLQPVSARGIVCPPDF